MLQGLENIEMKLPASIGAASDHSLSQTLSRLAASLGAPAPSTPNRPAPPPASTVDLARLLASPTSPQPPPPPTAPRSSLPAVSSSPSNTAARRAQAEALIAQQASDAREILFEFVTCRSASVRPVGICTSHPRHTQCKSSSPARSTCARCTSQISGFQRQCTPRVHLHFRSRIRFSLYAGAFSSQYRHLPFFTTRFRACFIAELSGGVFRRALNSICSCHPFLSTFRLSGTLHRSQSCGVPRRAACIHYHCQWQLSIHRCTPSSGHARSTLRFCRLRSGPRPRNPSVVPTRTFRRCCPRCNPTSRA